GPEDGAEDELGLEAAAGRRRDQGWGRLGSSRERSVFLAGGFLAAAAVAYRSNRRQLQLLAPQQSVGIAHADNDAAVGHPILEPGGTAFPQLPVHSPRRSTGKNEDIVAIEIHPSDPIERDRCHRIPELPLEVKPEITKGGLVQALVGGEQDLRL